MTFETILLHLSVSFIACLSLYKTHIPQQGSGGELGVSGFTGLTEVHLGWKVFLVRETSALPSPPGPLRLT